MKKYIIFWILFFSLSLLIGQVVDEEDMHISPTKKHQTEVHISINKAFENILMLSMNIDDETYDQGYFYSTNSGSSWSGDVKMPDKERKLVGGDPVTAFDKNGDFYLLTLLIDKLGGPDSVKGYLVYSSSDPDDGWNERITRDKGLAGMDKEMAVFDDGWHENSSLNNFYFAWTDYPNNQAIMFERSEDNLNNFIENPIPLGFNGQGVDVKTGPEGEVYLCWTIYGANYQLPGNSIGFASSDDGGVSFTTNVPFTFDGIQTTSNANPAFGGTRVVDYPSMAVDRSCGPHRGRIYIAYPEFDDNGDAVIRVRFSDDKGLTFSDGLTISTDEVEQAFMPWIACDPKTGIVVVTYHGLNQIDEEANETNTFVAFTSNGWDTFDNIKVSDESHNRQQRIPGFGETGKNVYLGSYIGIDIYDGIAYAAWADNRDSYTPIAFPPNNDITKMQVYVSRLNLNSIIEEEILSTFEDLAFNNFQFSDPNVTYRADNIIVSGNSDVLANSKLTLIANNSISISPDFHVDEDAEFSAYIDPLVCQTPGFNPSRKANPNGQNLNLALNFENLESPSPFQIFPNPASKEVILKCLEGKISQIYVFNLFGAETFFEEIETKPHETTLQIESWSNGPYFIRVITSDGIEYTKKLIVRH
jgi:hypothetical protein